MTARSLTPTERNYWINHQARRRLGFGPLFAKVLQCVRHSVTPFVLFEQEPTMNAFQIFSSSLTKHLLSVLLCGLIVTSAGADEWAQWMGPNRDGVYSESGIIDAIPESGLKIKWRMPINGGYACLLYTSPSPRDGLLSRMPSSA